MKPFWVILTQQNVAIRFSSDFERTSSIDFKVFSACEAFDLGATVGTWELLDQGSPSPLDAWENVFWELGGTLKWDGCINWHTNPECMMHGCGPAHVGTITAIFQTVYNIGKRHMDLLGDEVEPLPDGALEIA